MAIVNITCENDADFVRGFLYQDQNGVPIDLTGNTMRMGIRKHASDVAELLLLTTENGAFVVTSATGGAFTLTILKDQLFKLGVGSYEHSLIRIVGATPNYLRIWSGALVNNPGPSRGINT